MRLARWVGVSDSGHMYKGELGVGVPLPGTKGYQMTASNRKARQGKARQGKARQGKERVGG